MRHKYICENCEAGQDRTYVEAMVDAGYRVDQIACRECGQQAIRNQGNPAETENYKGVVKSN
jgi:DNA polymerase III alpha subunit (gram-positive type)